MIPFKQFLGEKWKDTIVKGKNLFDIFENPTFDELKEIDTFVNWKIVRIIIPDRENILAFGDILHSRVITKLKLAQPVTAELNFISDAKSSKYDCTITITSTNFDYGWSDIKEILEFVEANTFLTSKFNIHGILFSDEFGEIINISK